ncbi:hypothetical protein NKJ36_30965 [Mesorhizobium sp. M0142]|uniref:acyltransferase family protein n=1 Tax=unclassified Mesorhizobium TaxID=325217 RepID=UPI0033395EA6
MISYSLYLVHVPIGMRFVKLSERVFPGSPWLASAIALAACFGAALLLWYFVEEWAKKQSKKIDYGSKARRAAPDIVKAPISDAEPQAPLLSSEG